MRQCCEPDDCPGGGTGAGDGAASLDRRGTVAPGATGAGGECDAGLPGSGDGRGVCVVVRTVCGEQDQSGGQSGTPLASGGLAGVGIRRRADSRGDASIRPDAGTARVGHQAGERAEGRLGPSSASAPDARTDRGAGGVLFSGVVRGRPVWGDVRAAVQPADRLLGGTNPCGRHGHATRAGSGVLESGGRPFAHGARRRDSGNGGMGAARRRRVERIRFGERCASGAHSCLFSEGVAGLGGHDEGPDYRGERLPRE